MSKGILVQVGDAESLRELFRPVIAEDHVDNAGVGVIHRLYSGYGF